MVGSVRVRNGSEVGLPRHGLNEAHLRLRSHANDAIPKRPRGPRQLPLPVLPLTI